MGRATALALARAGADVAVLARTEDALDEVASEIRGVGRHGVSIPVTFRTLRPRGLPWMPWWKRWAGSTSWCTPRAGISRGGR